MIKPPTPVSLPWAPTSPGELPWDDSQRKETTCDRKASKSDVFQNTLILKIHGVFTVKHQQIQKLQFQNAGQCGWDMQDPPNFHIWNGEPWRAFQRNQLKPYILMTLKTLPLGGDLIGFYNCFGTLPSFLFSWFAQQCIRRARKFPVFSSSAF